MRARGGGNNINGGGRGGGGGPPADLLVCFPARARLALMPKPVCSPSRSAAADVAPKRRQYPSSRSATRGQVASPLFCRSKTRDTVRAAPALLAEDAVDISEPTSPKVTCAGQIKVSSRPKTSKLPASGASSGANKQSWLSVTEELRRHQRRHGIRGHSSSWLDALGLKKEAVHLLHGLRLRMRCFGSFRDIVVREDDQDDSSGAAGEGEEEGEEEEEDQDELEGKQGDAHRTIFSKWFMLLQEESPRDQGSLKKKAIYKDEIDQLEAGEEEDQIEGAVGGCLKYVTPSSPCASCSTPAVVLQAPPPPPPNALLLMRCRSAPSKGCRPDIGAGGADGTTAGGAQGDHGRVTITTSAKKKTREDIEKEKDQERLMLMISYAPDLFKVSPDIAKETWLVGSFDPLLRSRSWKT